LPQISELDVWFNVRIRELSHQIADSTAADLDVGVGAGVFGTVPRAGVCVDIDIPQTPPPFFVRASAEFLPFRDKSFEIVKAYNVLEHVTHPWDAIREILRVGSTLIARQDNWTSFAMWATPEHEWLQLPGLRFLKLPRTSIGIEVSRMLRRIAIKPRFGGLISKAHLRLRWSYYSVERARR